MFAETYYFLTIPLMMLIHAGFLAYEMGATRVKNVLSSGIKNLLAFAFTIVTFYFFGWWFYWALPTWPMDLAAGPGYMEISGIAYANAIALPWGDSAQYMGPNMGDHASGVFWGAFALFAATTASIASGALIERIQTVGFVICAIVLGSFAWVVAAAWGWHADGWLVTEWGFHDFGAAGLVHAVAGFFALGVLINLGPRVGKFNADGSANHIAGHNMPSTIVGLMLIIVGFFGFLMACIILPGEGWSWYGDAGTTIYGTPMTLSALAFNIVMAVSGGIIGAWIFTKDPFWMMSGALAGIISVASGLDVYFPAHVFLIATVAGIIIKPCADWLEARGIDDAVGAVTIHGTIGLFGVIVLGIFGSGMPGLGAYAPEGTVAMSFVGQVFGSIIMFLLGFVPGYVVSWILNKAGMLRIPDAVQIKGLDPVKVPAQAYPEGMTSPESEN
ncbi:MAG: ammonium transporter [Gammaproteobacteria bacterium]|nr:ammonium transporter [Gammaproteobacteria bacterium]